MLCELGPINNNGLRFLAPRARSVLVNMGRMAFTCMLATPEVPVLQWVTVVRNSAG